MLKLGVPAPFSESDELAQPAYKSWTFREMPGSILKFWHYFPKDTIFHGMELPLAPCCIILSALTDECDVMNGS